MSATKDMAYQTIVSSTTHPEPAKLPDPSPPLPFPEVHMAMVFRRDDGTCLGWDTWHPNRYAAEDACSRIGDSTNFVTRVVTYVPKVSP